MATKKGSKVIKADPSLWSKESQCSEAFHYMEIYEDEAYDCWKCGEKGIFTAIDQKYTFEVRKMYFWQKRILCQACYKQKTAITHNIQKCEKKWKAAKKTLKHDSEFLQRWLNFLISQEEYDRKKPNAAIKNMLRIFLNKIPNPTTVKK